METHVSQSHVTSSDRSNAFQYVMNNPSHLIEEDDIEFGNLVTFQSSPHSINKKAIDTKLIFDADHGYYSSRLSINLYVLPNGSYTMAFELIWSTDDVDRDNVSLNGISAVETVHDLSNKTFDNYSRLILQFTKSTDTSPNHLYIDIVIKINAGKLYPPKLQTYVVCYGVKGLQSDVPSNVWDALWSVDNGKITFNEEINMGNKKITGVADAVNGSDVITKSQIDSHIQNALKYREYYYFTNELKHQNQNEIRFPEILNSFPIESELDIGSKYNLKISLEGYYKITYTDYYRGTGLFEIEFNRINLFRTALINKDNWTPFTINCVIKCQTKGIYKLSYTGVSPSLLGKGYSTFFIQYIKQIQY